MAIRCGSVLRGMTVLAGLAGTLAAFPAAGQAAMDSGTYTLSLTKDYTASPWTTEVGYGNRAKDKLIFGVKNLLLGWTEFFTEPHDASQKGDNLLMGIGKGLKNGLEDTLGGVVHTVTFLIPAIDAPLPEGGVDLSSK